MRLFSLARSPLHAATVCAALLLAPALLLTAGCTPDPEEKAPQCPVAMLRPDASNLTRYDGHGTDLRNLVLSGRLLDVKGACRGLLGHKALTAHAHAEMVLTRGPAATGRDVDVPYVVAVMKNGQLLDRTEKVQHVTFPPNVDTVQVTAEEMNFAFPTTRGLGGEKYTIYFLFSLSPAELAANQRALRQ
ncbi:MAG: hypothetical protein WDN04_24710 [Rhodospirillales bacterium]